MELKSGKNNPDLQELLKKASDGDQEAFVKIAGTYSAYLKRLANGFAVPDAEKQDLYQEGLIGLYKAVMTYRPEISSFSTYCTVCARRSMISAAKKWKSKNRDLESLETGDGDEISDSSLDPQSVCLDKESYKALIERIDARLSDYEHSVLRLFLTGAGHDAIAQKLGTARKSVDNAILRIRRKLKPYIK